MKKLKLSILYTIYVTFYSNHVSGECLFCDEGLLGFLGLIFCDK